ncbi:hypothetical protein KJ980_03520 [Patescibacteria group bacterium]|nr:hypothetical protein [Patescibacteria group bacterium]MBU4016096.1 hypothetical protein [Patescibacteria group bacterium]MBU4098691.1 hypothetical protein [Patescibacteria group bacterium]
MDLKDSSRFKTLTELVLAIYQIIWLYNNKRIHSALKMAPQKLALLAVANYYYDSRIQRFVVSIC